MSRLPRPAPLAVMPRVLAVLLLAVLMAPASAFAATCPKTSVTDLADEVICLQCGVPLNLAEDAPSAKRERAFIQSRVDRCESKQQIKDQLVAQFGDRILAQPRSKTAWLVPAIAFAAAAIALALGARRWRRSRVPGPPAPTLGTRDSARLKADIERYDL